MLRSGSSFRVVLLATLVATSAGAEDGTQAKAFDPAWLDRSVDPCDDFFKYSCGNWIKANPIPADQPAWGSFSIVAERNRETLRDILEAAATEKPGRKPIDVKIGDFYATCMDEAAVEAKGLAPVQADLQRIAALRAHAELPALTAALHEKGVDAFFSLQAVEDFKQTSRTIALIDQAGMGLPERDYYFRDDPKSKEIRQGYERHIARLLELSGVAQPAAANQAALVLVFEAALAQHALPPVERRDLTKLYHKLSAAEVQALTPGFVWADYWKALGVPPVPAANVTEPEFFEGLQATIASAKLDTLRAYLRFQTLHAAARFLSKAFVDENFDFYGKQLAGTKELRARSKRCIDLVDESLGDALGQTFADRTFGADGQRRMQALVQRLREAMQADIASLDWMGAETKGQAQAKLEAMVFKIGVPEKWRDYTSVNVVRGDLLGNVQRAKVFEFRRQLAKIEQPTDRKEFGLTVPTVNAGYNPLANDLTFPAGILQPPFFYRTADDALNYGAVGAVIGHEITHGFDDEGRKTDGQGNLRDWWTEADGKQFEERAQCIVEQYGSYTAVDDIKLNGQLTLGENTADNGGLRIAYRAMKLAQAGQQPAPIDGLTADQRFFLGWSQVWCSSLRPEFLRMLAQVDPHSPGEVRVNGVVSNIAEFAQAYECKAGQPMVRAKVCRVW